MYNIQYATCHVAYIHTVHGVCYVLIKKVVNPVLCSVAQRSAAQRSAAQRCSSERLLSETLVTGVAVGADALWYVWYGII